MEFRPVIFVGHGSTGSRIISQINWRLNRDADPFLFQFYRFIRIASEDVPEKGVDSNIPGLSLSGGTSDPRDVLYSFEHHDNPEIKESFLKWWPKDHQNPDNLWIPRVESLDIGAGGVRPVGRLLLHYHSLRKGLEETFADIAKSLTATRDALPTAADQGRVTNPDRGVICYLFGLLAGGTCSGSFIELAHLIKLGLPNCRLFGVFLLGDICYGLENSTQENRPQRERQRRNTVAALAEISMLYSLSGRAIAGRDWTRHVGSSDLSRARFDTNPYDSITIIGAKNDKGVTLGNFDAYQELLASYYSSMNLTETNLVRIGKVVDDQANMVEGTDVKHPARVNNMERIGMLRLHSPLDKSRVLLRRGLMDAILTHRERNADELIWRQLADAFKNAIQWNDLGSHYAPPAETITGTEIDPLPDNPAELGRVLSGLRAGLESFHAPWLDVQSQSVAAKQTAFRALYQSAIGAMLDGALAGSAGRGVSLGNLHAAFKSLLADVQEQLRLQTTLLTETERKVLGGDASSARSRIDRELREIEEQYPKKRTIFNKGDREDRALEGLEALKRYSIARASLATARGVYHGLASLENELATLASAHKLVTSVLRDAIKTESAHADNAFKDRNVVKTAEVELLRSREDLMATVVNPILGEPTSPTDVAVQATSRAVAGWHPTDSNSLKGAYEQFLNLLRDRPDSRAEELALRVPGVKKLVDDLRGRFAEAFDAAYEGNLVPHLNELTVWDYMRIQVEQGLASNPGDTAEGYLQRSFREYGDRLGLFGALDPRAARDSFNDYDSYVLFLCDDADAVACFRSLGISNPDTFLSRLTGAALRGASHTPLSGGSRHEIVLYARRRGDSPTFFDGFREVSSALSEDDTPAQVLSYLEWSDGRFRDWIKEWHQAGAKPTLLD